MPSILSRWTSSKAATKKKSSIIDFVYEDAATKKLPKTKFFQTTSQYMGDES